MGAPLLARGGVLTRGRRRALKAAAPAAALLLALALAPGPVARRLLPRLRPAGGRLTAARVSGDLIRGLVLEDAAYSRPGLDVTARRVRLRFAWRGLLRRHLAIERLAIVSPRARAEPERAAPWPSGAGGWTVSVRRFDVSDGSLAVVSSSGTRRLEGLSARGALQRGTLALESATAQAAGVRARARGRVSRDKTALELSLSGETTGLLRLSGGGERWRAEGRGRWRGAAWSLVASLDGASWAGRADLLGLEPGRLDARAAGRAGPLSVTVRGAGRGWSPASASGDFDALASERDGLAARGRVAVSSGAARFDVAFSSGASGTLSGALRLADRSFEARWRLEGDAPLRRLGASARALAVEGRARGRWPDARWTVAARARGLRAGAALASSAALEVSGRGSGALEARLAVADARAGGAGVKRGALTLSGAPRDHAVTFSIDAGTVAATGRGRGSWRDGAWTARWQALALAKPRVMRSERPFSTTLGRGRFSVSGLALAGERDSRLEVDARRDAASWTRLSARARCDLPLLFELGLMRAPTSGRAALALDLTGSLRAPSGRAALDVTHARLAEIDAGSATVRVAFDGRLIRIETFDWKLGRGRLALSGELPIQLSGPRSADFALRVRAQRLSLAPLARRLAAVGVTRPKLDADLRLRRERGRWSLQGGGRVDAEAVALPAAGLALGASEVEFAARGDRLEITRSRLAASGKGATAALSGALTPDGPAVRFVGGRLRADSGQGLTAEADADVAVGGSWRAPAVTGLVRLRRGELAPLTARQKRRIDERERELAAASPPHPPSPASADVRVVFDGNVWYRERATAIELEGDVRLRKKPLEPVRLVGTVETVRGDYVYFSRVFKVESGSLKLAGETPMDAVVSARGLYVDDATRTKVHLRLSGTLDQPKLALGSEPPMDERDIVSFLVTGRPLYEVGGLEAKRVGGTAEAASVMADYVSQGLRRYLPPQLALDVFRLEVQRGAPGVTVGRYVTRRLFVTYGQTTGVDGGHRVDATYTLSPHWSVETQSTNQRGGLGTSGTTDNIVDLLFSFGFR